MQKYLKFYLGRCSGFKPFQEYVIYINKLLYRRFFKSCENAVKPRF